MRNPTGNKNSCPKCGAAMKLLDTRSGKRLICDYCGYETLPAAKSLSPEELEYEREKGRLRAKREAAAAVVRKRRRILLGTIAAIAVLLITALIIRSHTKQTIDPFDYVTVTFSGGNGKGEAFVHVRKDEGIDTTKIRYILSRSYGLNEGEEIEVEAESSEYLLSSRKQTYTVQGLDTYLTDLDVLSDTAIEVIHTKSLAVSKRNRDRSSLILHDCTYCEPSRMYLLTDEKNRNLLYDVFEAGFAMENDEVYRVYLVTYYENIVVRDTENVSIDYGRCFYDGNTLQFGESIFHMSTITGYETTEEIEADLLMNQDTEMVLKMKDTSPKEDEEE